MRWVSRLEGEWPCKEPGEEMCGYDCGDENTIACRRTHRHIAMWGNFSVSLHSAR